MLSTVRFLTFQALNKGKVKGLLTRVTTLPADLVSLEFRFQKTNVDIPFESFLYDLSILDMTVNNFSVFFINLSK